MQKEVWCASEIAAVVVSELNVPRSRRLRRYDATTSLDTYGDDSRGSRECALTLTGDSHEAVQKSEAAVSLDPMSFDAGYRYGRARSAEGHLDEAARLFARAGEVRQDDYQSMARCSMAHERPGGALRTARETAEETVRRCRRTLDMRPDDTRALTLGAGALRVLGQTEEARQWANRALEISPRDISVLHNAGGVFASLGAIDRTLDIFGERFRQGKAFKDWIDHDPDFDNIRHRPLFRAMLRT